MIKESFVFRVLFCILLSCQLHAGDKLTKEDATKKCNEINATALGKNDIDIDMALDKLAIIYERDLKKYEPFRCAEENNAEVLKEAGVTNPFQKFFSKEDPVCNAKMVLRCINKKIDIIKENIPKIAEGKLLCGPKEIGNSFDRSNYVIMSKYVYTKKCKPYGEQQQAQKRSGGAI